MNSSQKVVEVATAIAVFLLFSTAILTFPEVVNGRDSPILTADSSAGLVDQTEDKTKKSE